VAVTVDGAGSTIEETGHVVLLRPALIFVVGLKVNGIDTGVRFAPRRPRPPRR
jgi:hypothetical protein